MSELLSRSVQFPFGVEIEFTFKDGIQCLYS